LEQKDGRIKRFFENFSKNVILYLLLRKRRIPKQSEMCSNHFINCTQFKPIVLMFVYFRALKRFALTTPKI